MPQVGTYPCICWQRNNTAYHQCGGKKMLFRAQITITLIPVNKSAGTAFYFFSFTVHRKSGRATHYNNWLLKPAYGEIFLQNSHHRKGFIAFFCTFRKINIAYMPIVRMQTHWLNASKLVAEFIQFHYFCAR